MRIEHLRFCNINSLKGEWYIDFTNPELADAGLFLITGPTGSGKSTLLDAVCLALYGKTPRLLSTISGTSNEAMTRHTGKCFSEVIYSTDEGRYRALWFQHRAREKAGGKLQTPRCEFEDYANRGKVETKRDDVQKLVQETTGMSFEQFMRSMLLAQGEFARFLNASPAERSPILEEITGTEVYTDISKKAYERCSAETQLLKDLKIRLDAVSVLDPAEEARTRALQGTKGSELDVVQHRLGQAEDRLDWLAEGLQLEARVAGAARDLAAASELDKSLALVRDRLAGNERAARLDAPRATLARERSHGARLQKDMAQVQEQLPAAERAVADQNSVCQEAEKVCVAAEAAATEAAPQIAALRDLDTRLAGALAAHREVAGLVGQKMRDRESARTKALATAARKQQCQTMRAALAERLAATAQDANLATDLRVIEQSVATWQTHGKTLADEQKAAARAAKELEKTRGAQQLALQQQDLAATALSQGQEQVIAARAKVQEILGTTTLSSLRSLQQDVREGQEHAARASEQLASLATAHAAHVRLQAEQQAEAARFAELAGQLDPAREKVAQLGALVESLNTNVRMALTIRSLDDHRRALQAGAPCPCCGSTEHPWATGIVLEEGLADATAALASEQGVEGLEKKLAKARTDQSRAEKELHALEVNQVASQRLLTGLAERLAQSDTEVRSRLAAVAAGLAQVQEDAARLGNETVLGALHPQVQAACAGMAAGFGLRVQEAGQFGDLPAHLAAWAGESGEAGTQLARCAAELGALGQALASRIAQGEAAQARLEQLEKAVLAGETALEKARAEVARLAESLQHGEAACQECAAHIAAAQERVDAARADLIGLCAPYGLGEADLAGKGAAAQVVRRLQERREVRGQLEAEDKRQEQVLATLEQDEHVLRSRLADLEAELAQLVLQEQEKRAAHAALASERQERFGERVADTWEKDLQSRVNAARKSLDKARTVRQQALDTRTTLQTRLQSLYAECKANRDSVAAGEAALEEALAREGFATLDEVCAARLEEGERAALVRRTEEAAATLVRARGLHTESLGLYAAHVAQAADKVHLEPDNLESATGAALDVQTMAGYRALARLLDRLACLDSAAPTADDAEAGEADAQAQRAWLSLEAQIGQAGPQSLADLASGIAESGAPGGTAEPAQDLFSRARAQGLEQLLQARVAHLQEQQNSLQRELGVLAERLANNARNHAQHDSIKQEYEAQKEVAARWKELNTLIGSSDGKKFRNFAQGLTFSRLVRCANAELVHLSDRYVLTQALDNPLEFNVLDRWQGNEQRSIKNLSGGETFLVSLALALGLSSLSGGKVRIETMFLDEGFGTLDAETLETAVTTLAGLKGRGTALIGIISHVEALQERVETQIRLQRGADGTSVLRGPGCHSGTPDWASRL